MALRTIFAGTVDGVLSVHMQTGAVHPLGLHGSYINHLSKLHNTLAVACPQLGRLHAMPVMNPAVSPQTRPNHRPGLHLLTLASPSPDANPAPAEPRQLWSGDARSCHLAQPAGDVDTQAAAVLVGTEPADVHVTEDDGATWHSSQAFESIPTRASWSFPVTPHNPHVLSLDPAQLPDGTPALIAGIEVGGVLSTTDLGRTWQQHTGLYEDVHSVRSDPFNRRRWLAITGGGMGGKAPIYLTEDGGATWKGLNPLPSVAKLYVVGQSWSPYKRGDVLLTAGFAPPSRGTHVLYSGDSGVTYRDVTEGVRAAVGEGAMGFTPVPLWVGEGVAALGMCDGRVVVGEGEGLGAWRAVADVGAKINVLASSDEAVSPSAVTH